MNGVKVAPLPPMPDGVEPHVVALLGRALEVARQTLLAQDRVGLRPSHLRVLSHVPPEGTTISELATVLFMTKQGVGQFVGRLEAGGHLEVRVDAQDRRRRLVVRTPRGSRAVQDLERTVAAVERRWQQQVGPERYAAFREVLEELAGNRSAAASSS